MSDLLTYIQRLHARGTGLEGVLADSELVARLVSQRDQAAFELVVWRHGPMVFRLCKRMLRHEQDIEDAFQAVFLVLLDKAGSITRHASLSGWLYKVAYRVALRARADSSKRRIREGTGVETVLDDSPGKHAGSDPRLILDELIDGLSEKYRTPIVLSYFQGKTHREIAEQLGCAEGTVACRLSRARQLLRSRLDRDGYPVSAGFPALFAQTASPVSPPHRLVRLCTEMAATRYSDPANIARVVALARGVMRTMFWNKTKIAGAGVLALMLAGSGVSMLVNRAPGAKQDANTPVASESRPPAQEKTQEAAPVQTEKANHPKSLEDHLAVLRLRTKSVNNLKQIGLALLNYNDAYKSLPPRKTASKEGNPLLSWRVLILPYLEEMDLYKEFHLDEPWDSPHNKPLLSRMPPIYASPGKPISAPYATYYQVFTGEGAGFEDGRRLRVPDSFPDGCHQTLAVVEAGSPVPWTKPEDIPYSADKPVPQLGGLFDGIFNGVVFDGSVMTFKKDADPKILRAAITRNGRENLDIDLILASADTGIKINAAELEATNRNLMRQLERAQAELDKLTADKRPLGTLDYSDPRMAHLVNQHNWLKSLLDSTRAWIEAEKASKKDHQPPP